MKNKQLSMLLQGALGCQDCKGLKFAYALQKNIRLMKQEIKNLYTIISPDEDYKAYDKEREALAKEHSEKDKDGNPVVEEERYKIKNKKKFDKALEVLQKKYDKAFKQQRDKEAFFNERLEDDCKIEFHYITEKDLPEDMSARQLDIVSSFMYNRKKSDEVEAKREEHKNKKLGK